MSDRRRSATAFVIISLTTFVALSHCAVTYSVSRFNASIDDSVNAPRNRSTSIKRLIRGERKAAVITQRLPDIKTEVCQAERLEQIIKVRGCDQRTIVNRYCYGQCNSFFIPRSAIPRQRAGRRNHPAARSPPPAVSDELAAAAPSGRGRSLTWAAFRSCSYCRPKRVEWITVGLRCPRRRPGYRRRSVQIVKECACAALTLD